MIFQSSDSKALSKPSIKFLSTTNRSLPLPAADPTIVDALKRCTTRTDVRNLRTKRGLDNVSAAWKELDSLTKASLLLTKQFDGVIVDEH